MKKTTTDTNCSFGCVSLLITFCLLWATFGTLPTFWGGLELDFFWPAVRLDGITYIGNPN